jgi:large subunit ribosomal protein L3
MKSILGRKIGMTQIFDEEGRAVQVTVVAAGPCTVVQVKTAEHDGYSAIQVGFEEQTKTKRMTKAEQGHFTKHNVKPFRVIREIRLNENEKFEVGQSIGPEIFEGVKWVDVSGITKGKGFQGVMKRCRSKGGANSHGSMFHRAPGSIGASSDPSRVFKGASMPGHMGDVKVTAIKLKLVQIDKANNLLLIRGAIPGANQGLLVVKSSNRGGKR